MAQLEERSHGLVRVSGPIVEIGTEWVKTDNSGLTHDPRLTPRRFYAKTPSRRASIQLYYAFVALSVQCGRKSSTFLSDEEPRMGMESPQSQTVRAGQMPHRWTGSMTPVPSRSSRLTTR